MMERFRRACSFFRTGWRGSPFAKGGIVPHRDPDRIHVRLKEGTSQPVELTGEDLKDAARKAGMRGLPYAGVDDLALSQSDRFSEVMDVHDLQREGVVTHVMDSRGCAIPGRHPPTLRVITLDEEVRVPGTARIEPEFVVRESGHPEHRGKRVLVLSAPPVVFRYEPETGMFVETEAAIDV